MNNDFDWSVYVFKFNSKCDDVLLEGWYCFNSIVGIRILDYCVNMIMCNIYVFGWFNGNYLIL